MLLPGLNLSVIHSLRLFCQNRPLFDPALLPVGPPYHLALDGPMEVIVVRCFCLFKEAPHFHEVLHVHSPVKSKEGGNLVLGVRVCILTCPDAIGLCGACYCCILHGQPQTVTNLCCNNAQYVLDHCHIPLNSNFHARVFWMPA